MHEEILAAVAAEPPAMVGLLAELVEERTLLGREASGQAVMRFDVVYDGFQWRATSSSRARRSSPR